MRKILDKFDPSDVIAFTVISGCVILIAKGHDGPIKDILLTITGYYFGKKGTEIK